MLKLKFQYFDYLTRRANSLEKTLMLEKRAYWCGQHKGFHYTTKM